MIFTITSIINDLNFVPTKNAGCQKDVNRLQCNGKESKLNNELVFLKTIIDGQTVTIVFLK